MSHPFFPCSVCSAYVQLKWESVERYYMPNVSKYNISKLTTGTLMITSELESDDFANNCRGQGSKYSNKASLYSLKSPVEESDEHFNFSGTFKGVCCFCAVRMGLSSVSFQEISCYHCKQRNMLFLEFYRLRRVRNSSDGENAPSWETHGWGALSDTLIDYIIALATNNRIGRDGRVDRFLLEC